MDKQAYDALRQRAAYIDLTGRGKIRAVGDDRARLLHAMCTNHVQQLQPGTGCYAFFLTAQGRIVADANIFCMPDYFLLDTEEKSKQPVLEHLEKFIIADDVIFRDFTATTVTINVEGPAAEQVLCDMGALPTRIPYSIVEWGHKQIAHATYTGAPGYSIFVPDDEKDQLLSDLEAAGVPRAGEETADVVRIENGRARFGVDFFQSNIPQETERMDAVHFSKGCYLGQEIVERVRSRGHVNRVLVSLRVEAQEALPAGAKVQSDAKDVGEISSSAFSPALGKVAALAIVRAEAAEASSRLSVNGASATVAVRPTGG